MNRRAGDWLRQAEPDLEAARLARDAGIHEWACFASQQGAEKAVKALHLALGQEAWGHVVAKLLRELPIEAPGDLVDRAHVLDGFYIPARYPNGFPEGAPGDHIGSLQSREAVEHAGAILAFVRTRLAETG